MNHIIIGTAGHVDHGKTSLIKSLTGINTDRLQEEKQRGITIELGFANIDLGNGTLTGIVDVPGHEKFIKNMLAGAGGIDIALLVIAADEGFMPQTREHFSILSLMDIKCGVIAVTKTDMVDEEWLEAVIEDTRNEIEGSFLEGCKIIPVSSKTGENLEVLKDELKRLVENAEEKNTIRPFRLPVDRVFTVEGFGTVVTGTLIEGKVKVGDRAMIYPSMIESKIRNVQVHSADAEEAFAGQRVAINLGGVKRDKLQKGDCLTAPNTMENTKLIDCKLTIVKEFERVIKNNTRLHFHTGTRNILCNLILLDKESVKAGESCYVQLRLEEEVPVKYMDKYVVRFYSPLETVGGGSILEPMAKKHKRFDEKMIHSLDVKYNSEKLSLAHVYIEESGSGISLEKLATKLEVSSERCSEMLASMDFVKEIAKDKWLDIEKINWVAQRCVDVVGEFHKENPVMGTMDKGKLKGKLGKNIDDDMINAALDYSSELMTVGMGIKLKSFSVSLDESSGQIVLALREQFKEWKFTPPFLGDLEKTYEKEKGDFKKAIKAMCDSGELIYISQTYLLTPEAIEEAKSIVTKIFHEEGEIVLAKFRTEMDATRKYALPMLEYFDKTGVTKRVGENRVLK